MNSRPSLVPDWDVSLLDLRDSLIIRMKAVELIRRNIVTIMEDSEFDYLPATVFLLDTVIRDSKSEIALAFEAGQR